MSRTLIAALALSAMITAALWGIALREIVGPGGGFAQTSSDGR